MPGQIRISPEVMRGRAAEYRTEGEKVNEVIGRLDTLLSNLQSEWEGEASNSYAARYQELKPAFTQAETLIGEIATALDTIANTLEQTDAQIASSLKG